MLTCGNCSTYALDFLMGNKDLSLGGLRAFRNDLSAAGTAFASIRLVRLLVVPGDRLIF